MRPDYAACDLVITGSGNRAGGSAVSGDLFFRGAATPKERNGGKPPAIRPHAIAFAEICKGGPDAYLVTKRTVRDIRA